MSDDNIREGSIFDTISCIRKFKNKFREFKDRREHERRVIQFFENLVLRTFIPENVEKKTAELRILATDSINKKKHLRASYFPMNAMKAAGHAQYISGFVNEAVSEAQPVYSRLRYPFLFNPYSPTEQSKVEEIKRARAWRNQWILKVYGDRIQHHSIGSKLSEYYFNLESEYDSEQVEMMVSTDVLWKRIVKNPIYPDEISDSAFDNGYY